MSEAAVSRKVFHRMCPLCGRDNRSGSSLAFSVPEWPVKQCPDCDLVYIEYAPVYEELKEDFAWEKTSAEEQERRTQKRPIMMWLSKKTRWRLHLFKRKSADAIAASITEKGVVLDIGCGKGTQLARLPDRLTPYGIEISKGEADVAKELLAARGGRVICAPSIEGLKEIAEGEVACAIMRSYLEHEADPGGVLAGLHRVLSRGAAIVIKVPNYGSINRKIMGKKWCGFRFPDHLNYFDPKTLTGILRHHGFSRVSIGRVDRWSARDNMWVVAYKDG